MGAADTDNNLILIARDVFEMGEVMLISTILEEYFHLRDSVKDETREMQDSILNCLATLVVRNRSSSATQEVAA